MHKDFEWELAVCREYYKKRNAGVLNGAEMLAHVACFLLANEKVVSHAILRRHLKEAMELAVANNDPAMYLDHLVGLEYLEESVIGCK